MGSPPTEETKNLFKLLADGEWHSYEQVKEALARTVAPGPAFRRYQDRLFKDRARKGDTSTESPLSEETQIIYGSRDIAQAQISSWISRGGLLTEGKKLDRRIKINPEYSSWGGGQPPDKMAPKTPPAAPGSPESPQGYTDLPPGGSDGSTAAGRGPNEVARENPGATVLAGDSDDVLYEPVPQWVPPQGPSVPEPEQIDPELTIEQVPDFLRQFLLSVDPAKIGICPVCHLLMVDSQEHATWHREQDQAFGDREMGLIDEKAVRSLFDNALADGLNHFQEGLQSYLDQRFNEINTRIASLRLSAYPSSRWAKQPQKSTERDS